METPKTTANNGWFKQGNPGRPEGPNHLTKTVKETVLAVFNELQDDPKVKLSEWAKEQPTEFYKIAARLIPTDIKAEVRHTHVILQIVRNTPTILTDPAQIAAEGGG